MARGLHARGALVVQSAAALVRLAGPLAACRGRYHADRLAPGIVGAIGPPIDGPPGETTPAAQDARECAKIKPACGAIVALLTRPRLAARKRVASLPSLDRGAAMLVKVFDPGALTAPEVETTVQLVIEAYLTERSLEAAAGRLSAGALAKARFYLSAFAVTFGSLAVSACRRGDVRRFLNLHPEYKSPFTIADAAGQVVTAFRWAEEDGLIASCPYARPRDLPACEPRAPIRRDEIRGILAHARRGGYRLTCVRFRLALWFLWQSGARTCEMREVGWEHYDADRGLFELPGKTTRRTGQKRLLVLTPRAWRLIRWMRRWDNRVRGPVFLNGRGRAWTKASFGSLFRRHADAAGVRKEVSAYSARHGFCCEALERGAGERQLADFLGQTSTRYIGYYGRGVKTKVDYLRDAVAGHQEKRSP